MLDDLKNLGKRLTPNEAAEVLGVSETTLSNWREQKRGPAYLRLEGRFFYPEAWLIAYLRSTVVCHDGGCPDAKKEGE